MCGRYVTPDEAAMERAYNLTARQWEAWMNEAYQAELQRRTVVAPSQRVPVLRVIRQVGGERRIDPMRWGLIPFFARGAGHRLAQNPASTTIPGRFHSRPSGTAPIFLQIWE